MSDSNSLTIRKYLFDIAKIVEGAANADHEKVVAYTQQLCERLTSDGEIEGAKRLRQAIGRGTVTKLALARASGLTNGLAGSIPVDSESRLPMADEELIAKGEVDLFVSPAVEKSLGQFLSYYRAADNLAANGVGVSPSMLMYGPPGCGKTQMGRFIAAELGLPLITARIDSLISSFLGSTAKNIRGLFEHAVSRPCVLFLDEFDAIAKMRDDARELGELKRVVISLLQNIDAMGGDHVLLAATNHEHLLDPAIWRRFSFKIQVSEPDTQTRMRMLRRYFATFAGEDVIDAVAALSDGFSGAQLQLAAQNCMREAILRNENVVNLREAVESILQLVPDAIDAEADIKGRIRAIKSLNPKRFTQVRLAEIFGISQGQVSKLLKGED